ncbi:periplasmic 5'-nucleotidase [Caenispirillum salinarum AK4]|uniref:Periplasmic 5'-nucleotidase n=1 Tax=Caenispirillum salinarum AK4 TaxID=1238182 RepID=K9GUK6_9PROT|nr:bifunctional UDP-sugar hydrolase/5'-nucleotidase [Caenispirillum salinarum]EKV28892.1 periplasmic 5'-nucleotidase [Caenispirillum salinarum AK4]
MNAVGYDFMALGNHDFDYGRARTEALQSMADFPMRAANVIDARTGTPFGGRPTAIVERGGLRIGLLALGYQNTEWTASKKDIEGLSFTSGIDAARRLVPELRRQGADVVVVVSHQGTPVDRLLAQEVAGIDVILGGHSHNLISPPEQVNGTWITEAWSHGAVVEGLTLTVEGGRVTDVGHAVHPLWADRTAEDLETAALLAELRAPHLRMLEEVVAVAAAPLPRAYKADSPFDRLVGDILRARFDTDIALLPGVGYGLTPGPGPITRQALRSLLPHPAKVVTMTLTGAEIRSVLEQSLTNLKPDDPMEIVGGRVQAAELDWRGDLSRPVGQRVLWARVADRPLDPRGEYSVATNVGMAAGLHRYAALTKGRNVRRHDITLPEVVAQGLAERSPVQPPPPRTVVRR